MKFKRIIILLISFAIIGIILIIGLPSININDRLTNYYQTKLEIDSNIKGENLFEFKSETSFNGDGIHLIIYKLNIKNFEELKNNEDWNKYDDSILNKFWINYEETKEFSFPEKGYYKFFDKKDNTIKTLSEYYKKSQLSDNCIIAIIDFEEERLYYYELDT